MKLLIAVLVLLVASGEEPVAIQSNEDARSNTSGPVAAKSFAFEEETELYALKYSWSAEAAAIRSWRSASPRT